MEHAAATGFRCIMMSGECTSVLSTTIVELERYIMTHSELAESIRSDMFADRATIREAYDYALQVAKASGSSPQVMTAIHVMMNTIANTIDQIESAQAVA